MNRGREAKTANDDVTSKKFDSEKGREGADVRGTCGMPSVILR